MITEAPPIPPIPPAPSLQPPTDPDARAVWDREWSVYRWIVDKHLQVRAQEVQLEVGRELRWTESDVFMALAEKWGFRPDDTTANWPQQIEKAVPAIMAALARIDPGQR